MANLIPQVRVNKNGVPVTKHVRADATTTKAASIPAPAVSTKAVKAPKLLTRQTTPRNLRFDGDPLRPSYDLEKLLPKGGRHTFDIHASDVSLYEMFSAMGVNDALHLYKAGYSSKDEALGFLRENKLESLITDHSSMMKEALERRIPADKFAELHSQYGMLGHPPGLFLDAAEAYSSGTLKQIPLRGNSDVHLRVLSGEIDWADIKYIGVGKIQKSNAAHAVLDALQRMKSGEHKCSVDDIVTLIDKNNQENNSAGPLAWALGSINEYGVDFLTGLERLHSARQIAELSEHRKYSLESTKALIDYESRMRSAGSSAGFLILVKLKNAGVDPEMAGKLYTGSMSVEQIIGIHNEGIHASVSGGWL